VAVGETPAGVAVGVEQAAKGAAEHAAEDHLRR
jgi:hypothetical protein